MGPGRLPGVSGHLEKGNRKLAEQLHRVIEVPLGVTVIREKIDNPWQDCIWRPASVFLDAPPVTEWRLLRTGPGIEHYHVATLPLELHRKETAGYRVNLANGEPSVYVVMRFGGADGGGDPVHVHLLTASPFDIEAYGINSDEIIGRVAMPEPLVELVQAFIDAHHQEEPFKKRQRTRAPSEEDYKFGQEPLDSLRERMRRAGHTPDER